MKKLGAGGHEGAFMKYGTLGVHAKFNCYRCCASKAGLKLHPKARKHVIFKEEK